MPMRCLREKGNHFQEVIGAFSGILSGIHTDFEAGQIRDWPTVPLNTLRPFRCIRCCQKGGPGVAPPSWAADLLPP